jgi:hypothetical protein
MIGKILTATEGVDYIYISESRCPCGRPRKACFRFAHLPAVMDTWYLIC